MTSFKPLLASTVEDLNALRYPLLASPKLDGIRCVKLDGKALSRKLKPIPNDFVRNWVETNLPDGIDGELMLRDRRAPFSEVSSAIMSKDGKPDFVFCAFDLAASVPFEDRLSILERWRDHDFQAHEDNCFLVVEHVCIEEADVLTSYTCRNLELGYEGTMVRDPQGPYKFGRSTLKEGILLKIKPFADEEAVVVSVVEQMHNGNEATVDALGHTKRSTAKAGKVGKGVLGALKCVAVRDGVEFEVGTGFTDQQRREWFGLELAGRLLKFKHQPPPGGRKFGEAPRFPVFLGWRED